MIATKTTAVTDINLKFHKEYIYICLTFPCGKALFWDVYKLFTQIILCSIQTAYDDAHKESVPFQKANIRKKEDEMSKAMHFPSQKTDTLYNKTSCSSST